LCQLGRVGCLKLSHRHRGNPRYLSVCTKLKHGFSSGTTEIPSISLQTLSTAPLTVVYDAPPSPVREIVTYSKEVQTVDDWSPPEADVEDGVQTDTRRHSRITDEALREQLRKEIEEELRLIQDNADTNGKPLTVGVGANGSIFARELTDEEKGAVLKSEDFVDFLERSSKVVERALDLDMEYDILADYGQGVNGDEETQSGRRIKEVARFYDERWSKKRMISDLHFSPKVCVVIERLLCDADCGPWCLSFQN